MSSHTRTCNIERLTADAKSLVEEVKIEKQRRARREKLSNLLERANEDPSAVYKEYKWHPKYVVWELSLACNMRCEHCGSAAGRARDDELNLDEMYRVCDELGELGCERVTLLGGEPLIHKNWKAVANRIRQNGYRANVITNGWNLNRPKLCDDIKEAGLTIVGISVDGYGENHDKLRRKPGSFERILEGIDLLKEREIPVAISTVITNDSLNDLERLYNLLLDKKVKVWQLQTGSPLGRMEKDNPLIIKPERIREVLEFAHIHAAMDDGVHVDLADDVGYFGSYSDKNVGRNKSGKYSVWKGCYAGIQAMGIDSNGDIKGCQSHPSLPQFIHGNVRERSLKDIWNDPKSFPETRNFKNSMLGGYCAECVYGSLCKAGCTSQAFSFTGTIGDNPMCIHRVEQNKA